MKREEKVIRYYVLCNKLKNVIRTGWLNWNVTKDRVESVAEHIYGVQMLAIAMYSEFQYDIDILKVIYMLALHELEEIYIGDITPFQMSKEEKETLGHEAVSKVLDGLKSKNEILRIIEEFDKRETAEARFAYFCDKLESDLQSRLYDLEGCVDINNLDNNETSKHELVQKLLNEGKSFSEMWIEFGQMQYNYDSHFKSVANYGKNHDILSND